MNRKLSYEDLRKRVEALEQENEQLKSELLKQKTLFESFSIGVSASDSNGKKSEIEEDRADQNILETEQIKIQQELLNRNTFIETILDYLPIGLGVNFIENGQVTYLNKKWEEIYGWPKEEFPTIEHFFEKVFPDADTRKILQNKILDDISSGDPDRMAWDDLEITTKNGEKRIVYAKNIPLLDQNLMISTVQDFTEKRKLEAQVQQSQKLEAIGTLAGGIAHDFNNILGIITGNISYLLSFSQENTEFKEVLSDIREGAIQAQNLTHQLLTFAKGGEPIKKTLNMNKLLEESARFVTRGAKSKCKFKLADNLGVSEIDSGQIHQVISNLLINADQAMPKGGVITIRSKNVEIEADNETQLSGGRYIKISIEDQGIGIQEKDIPKIFDPYYTTKQQGSGLGLATSYSIIKRHGGHIDVYSESGKGTVFNIYLPVSLRELAETKKKEDSIHLRHLRVLIMDDEDSILKMSSRMFNRMECVAESAKDGEKAIQLYREAWEAGTPFDLVILDLTVSGGMGGAETILELAKINTKVKAVVSSGYSNDPIMSNYQDYGFCGVIPKPYTKEQMEGVLDQIFGKKYRNCTFSNV